MDEVINFQHSKFEKLNNNYKEMMNLLKNNNVNKGLVYHLKDINDDMNSIMNKIDVLKLKLKDGIVELKDEERMELESEEKADGMFRELMMLTVWLGMMT